ncbi:MAG: cupin domain-containing protein [Methanomassiliicoccales archaeon]
MLLKHASEVPVVDITKPGFIAFQARYLLTKSDGCPNYALRLMEFGPGGCTSYHHHKEEHEMFFLEGTGVLLLEGGREVPVKAGDALLLMPCEYHQLRNSGPGLLRMICTVPLLEGKDGKDTTACP